MTEYEHIKDTILHKKFMLECGLILIDYLYKNNRSEEALELAKRCARHDNSKFEGEEIAQFIKLDKSRTSMIDSEINLSEDVKRIIAVHWKNNKHHPEHFKSYKDMTEIDIMEMVCDWYARSQQFKTDFLSFVKTRQEKRFCFDEEFFEKVYNYCTIIHENN